MRRFILCLTCLAMLVSCSKEQTSNPKPQQKKPLTKAKISHHTQAHVHQHPAANKGPQETVVIVRKAHPHRHSETTNIHSHPDTVNRQGQDKMENAYDYPEARNMHGHSGARNIKDTSGVDNQHGHPEAVNVHGPKNLVDVDVRR